MPPIVRPTDGRRPVLEKRVEPWLFERVPVAVCAPQVGGEGRTFGNLGRYVLGAMDRDIDLAVHERLLELANKNALTAELQQRCHLISIALRRNEDLTRLNPTSVEQIGGFLRLPPRELTAPRAQPQGRHLSRP